MHKLGISVYPEHSTPVKRSGIYGNSCRIWIYKNFYMLVIGTKKQRKK